MTPIDSTMQEDVASDELFREYRATRSRALRNRLIERYTGLAVSLARRFEQRGEPLDDLRQVALVGLLKAVERFEPQRGLQFSSFATPTITGELKRHFRDQGWAVRVPRRVQELHLRLPKLVAELSQRLSRPPTTAEVAAHAGASEEEVLEAMEASDLYRLASLDEPRHLGEGGEVGTTIGMPDPAFEAAENRSLVSELLAGLDEREQRIVSLRFFDGLTQSEIAAQVGVSQMHVSRLLTRSLKLLAVRARSLGLQQLED